MKMPAPILLLDNSYSFGGAINSLSNLVKALDKEKFSPVVVSGQPPDFLEKHFDCSWYHYKPKLPWVDNAVFEKIKAIPLFKIKVLQKALYISRSVYWLFFIIFPEAFKYYAIGRTHKVAMVHLNNIFGSQLSGIISAKLLGVPCVAHLRDFEKAGFFNRCLAKLIDQHIAISTSIRDNLAMLEVPDEKISIIYDAIDLDEFDTDVSSKYLLDEFCIGKDQKIFGIFGRVLAWKGTREFVLAAAEVIKRIPEAMAFIVGSESDGDKEYAREVNLLVNNMSLQDRIVFTGYRE
ncbi:MAG: glycosyltransferase, partial [Desulfobacteraceae bacterium]|nr:glycosyltransferase [Desulfobacteraceae bacterium]